MEYEKEMKEHEIDCAVDTLIRAEEIKKNPELMAKVLEKAKEKRSVIDSIAKLKMKASEVRSEPDEEESEYGDDPELRTEEDKAALQQKKEIDGKLAEMGMGPKRRKKA